MNENEDLSLRRFDDSMRDKFCNIFQFSYENYEQISESDPFSVMKRKKGINLFRPNKEFHNRMLPGRLPSQDISKLVQNTKVSTYEMEEKLSKMKHYYLVHSHYSIGGIINYEFLEKEIDIYSKHQHIALAKFQGYNLYDRNGNHVPTIMTERPLNGPILTLFESVKKEHNDSPLKSGKQHFYPYFDLDLYDAITPEQKFAIIVGIIAGVAFIHKNNFIHANLNPNTIYIDEHLHPIICDYAFNIPFKILNNEEKKTSNKEEASDENDMFSEDDSNDQEDEEEEEEEEEEEISFNEQSIEDAYNINPKNKNKYLYYTNNENITNHSHLAFIAPELFITDSEKSFNNKIDIYSIGVLIYYILTENLPNAYVEDTTKHINLPLLDNLNDSWKKIILKCLSNNPNKRYSARKLFNKLTSKKSIGHFLKAIPQSNTNKLSADSIPYILYLIQDLNFKEDQEISVCEKIIPSLAEIDYNDRLIIYAAEKGNKECLEKIGIYFDEGKNKFLKDYFCAFYCFENAQPRILSTIKYAEYKHKGLGTCKDLTEALKKFKSVQKKINKTDPYYEFVNNSIIEIEKEQRETQSVIMSNIPIDTTDDAIRKLCRTRITIEDVQDENQNKHFKTKFIKFDHINGKNNLLSNYTKNPDIFNGIKIKSIKDYVSPKVKFLDSLKLTDVPKINLQNYTLQDNSEQGSGQYGKIYSVIDNRDNKKYAAKLFFYVDVRYRENINKIKREIVLSSKFDQPTIVKIIGYNPKSILEEKSRYGNITLLMNFVPNGTLEDMITKEFNKHQPEWWNDTTKLKIIIGIAYAMATIHCKHIIHRDLKTENILINENYEPVICDFGCSKEYDPSEDIDMTKNIGTSCYMAPEVYYDAHSYKWEVDVFSFGVILYQIISAKPMKTIFPEIPQDQFFQEYVKYEIRPQIDITNNVLKELVEQCWNNKIDSRPDFQHIYDKLKSAIKLNQKLLPNAEIDKVKEYITFLEKGKK